MDVLIIIAGRGRVLRDGLESIEFEHMLNNLLNLEVNALLLHLQLDLLFRDLLNAPNFLEFLAGAADAYHRAALLFLLNVLQLFLGGLILQ